MLLIRIAAVAGVLLASAAHAAPAMSPEEEGILRQSCTGDYMRFCAMFDPGSPQVEQCFQTNMKQLSPRCQSAISTYSKANPAPRRR